VESLVKLLQVAKKMMVNHQLKIQLKYQEEKLKLPKKLLKTLLLLIMLEFELTKTKENMSYELKTIKEKITKFNAAIKEVKENIA
jgi:hypothetical protein